MSLEWLRRDHELKDHRLFDDSHFGTASATNPPGVIYEERPVLDAKGDLIAVFDVDATTPAAFDAVDQAGLERLMARGFAAG